MQQSLEESRTTRASLKCAMSGVASACRWRSMRRAVGCVTGLLSLNIIYSGAAEAQATRAGWQFYFTPYLWVSGTSGNTHFSNPRIPDTASKVDFGDTLKHLNSVPIVGAMEIRNGRYSVFTDLTVASLSGNEATSTRLFNGASYRLTQLIATVLPSYRLIDTATQTLDVGAGARVIAMWSRTRLNAGRLPEVTTKFSKAWADPIIGAGYRVAFSPHYSFTAYADGGATGSTSTWQLMGTLDYQATASLKLFIGYRYLDIDHRSSAVDIDTALSGPLLGATIRF